MFKSHEARLVVAVLCALAAGGVEAQTSGSASVSGSESGSTSNSTSNSQAGNGSSMNNINASSGSNSNSSTRSSAQSGVSSQGQSVNNTVSISMPESSNGSGSGTNALQAAGAGTTSSENVNYTGSYTVKTAPPVAAPALTTTLSDTCMGSVSLGLSLTGFGFSGGTTMVDQACVRRLDAREFRAMGMNDVALALLCQSNANRHAVEAAGRACPTAPTPIASVGKPVEEVQAAAVPANEPIVTPIVQQAESDGRPTDLISQASTAGRSYGN